MADEYDIYGDLEGFEEEAAQDNKVVQELKAQIAELREQISKNEHEKQTTIARNVALLENISSLLLTAKAELKRKDAMIADIRRERDNAAFRRRRIVQRHDKGTQTTLIRLLSREVQTEVREAPQRIKAERDTECHRDRERKRVEEDHRRREREQRIKVKDRVSVRERLGERRGLGRHDMNNRRGRRIRVRTHDDERERERQARRGPRTPEADRHPVRFRSPVRVKAEEASVPDSASDIELSRTFIPMNRHELDRYVKEIGREQNRSPVVVVKDTEKNDISKILMKVSGTELGETRLRKKSKTPKKNRQLARKTPIKQKSPSIIQSDEIGTTACASSVLSPVKSDDIEQRMSALHGHPEPPVLIIPPPEPPIIEHVPELPLDDDAKLNDSRELKIIESSDELAPTRGGPAVEDVGNSSAETVIERSRLEDDEDLEDGEIITPVSSPAHQSVAEFAEENRNVQNAKAVAQLAQETQHNVKKKSVKPKRKRADRSPKVEPNPVEVPIPPKEPTPEQDKIGHKRNLNGAFKLPHQRITQRRNTICAGSVVDGKAKQKPRLSEPAAPKVAKKKPESLQELFGSDDDNSFVVAPEAVIAASGKRKRTESAGELFECKRSRNSEGDATKGGDIVEENKSAGTDGVEEIAKMDDAEDESTVEDKNEINLENGVELDSKAEQEAENVEVAEDKSVPEEVNEEPKSDSATSVESKDVSESESTASLNCIAQNDEKEVASDGDPAINENGVPESEPDPAPNNDEGVPTKEEIDASHNEEVTAAQDTVNVEADKQIPTSEDTSNQSREVIVMSNKYREYRIEEDNETEITFFVTRKKKKKTKSKSRNASLNASGAK